MRTSALARLSRQQAAKQNQACSEGTLCGNARGACASRMASGVLGASHLATRKSVSERTTQIVPVRKAAP